MRTRRSDPPNVVGYLILGFLALLAGTTVVVAPILLAFPLILLIAAAVLALSIHTSKKCLVLQEHEQWPRHALVALWVIVISLPGIVAFDPTGFTKDQGLFNPQSVGRIVIFLTIGLAGLVFWAKWGRSPMRKRASLAIPGTSLVFAFYGWYLLSAPLVIAGIPLALSAFRSLEWIVATGLIVLVFAAQNANGQTSFADRARLILPMLFFLLFSNLIALPIVPRMIYSISPVTGAGRLGGLFTHPNLLALVSTIVAAHAFAFLNGWKRFVLVAICVVVTVFTYSRGGFAAFALMIVFATWYLARGIGSKMIIIGAGMALTVALLQVPQIQERVVDFLARGTKPQTLGTFSERTAVWEASKILIQRSPWLGSSFIAGPKMLGDIMVEQRLSSNFAAPHAHNEFLQAQISGGLVAFFLSLLLHLRITYLLFRNRGLSNQERFFSWSVFGGCVLWGGLQPSLSYFLYLPGVLLIWLLFTLESLNETVGSRKPTWAKEPRSNLPRASATIAGIVIIFGILGAPSPSIAARPFADNSYVRVESGHLARDGRRLRVWGVNLQSGVFRSYSEIDALLKRIAELGFNAIRVWPTSGTFYRIDKGSPPLFNASVKGDGSDLDRFDYLLAAASKSGMNVQMTMLHYLDLPMIRASLEPALAEVARGSPDDSTLRLAHGFAPYVSSGYLERMKTHMHRVLARTNPYTGRRYADEPAVSTWELANESSFVHCAIDPACLRRLPAVLVKQLDSAWQVSPRNRQHSSLPIQFEGILEPGFYLEYSKFVIDQFLAVSNELRDHARRIGGENSGIGVQPFIFNTDPGERSAISHFAYAAGDVFSASAYSSPLSREHGYDGSAWLPFSAGGRPIPFLEYVKIMDKPFVMYEGSFFRPYPYRAEWGVFVAAIAIQQDWDGAFLFSYGQPANIYELVAGIPKYGNSALPVPVPGDSGERGHYAYGFHHGGDPIAMASWSLGGFLFLGAHDHPRASELIWDIPVEGLHTPGQGYPPEFMNAENLVNAPRRHTVSVRFTSTKGGCAPCLRKSLGTNSDLVQWDMTNRQLTVATSGGKAIAGELGGDLGVLDRGVRISVPKKKFGVIGVAKPPSRNARRLYLIGNASNFGATFDAMKIDYSGPSGALRGVLRRGSTPLVFSGPTADVSFDEAISELVERDFDLATTRRIDTPRKYEYSANDGVFFLDLLFRDMEQ